MPYKSPKPTKINPKKRKKITKDRKTPELTPEKLIERIRNRLPLGSQEVVNLLYKRDGADVLARELPTLFSPQDYVEGENSVGHLAWNDIGFYYRGINRPVDALKIYQAEYAEMIKAQLTLGQRIHKGSPLCWIHDIYIGMNCPVLAKRYIMLTLCEDAITHKGVIPPDTTGAYFRLVWRMGLPDAEWERYSQEIFFIYEKHPEEGMFPEWILQNIDTKWMTEYLTAEANIYVVNTQYVSFLLDRLGDRTGKTLERLAEYILSCIPGVRAECRISSEFTDYDVVCSLEGLYVDFRSCIDRYFICECKDWEEPANTTTLLKFKSVLELVGSKFGIIFSRNGITGGSRFSDATRDIVLTYQSSKIIIVVITFDDLVYVARGGNLISLLREKYERVRLDLPTRN